MNERTETNFDLDGQSVSAAAARLNELATHMGYHIVASGPRSYRLVRRRRQGLRKRTHTMTLTFVEDRVGVRVSVIGDIDTVLIEHLVGRAGASADGVANPSSHSTANPGAEAESLLPPAFRPPVVKYDLPTAEIRPARPPAQATGLISQVPVANPGDLWPAPQAVDEGAPPVPEAGDPKPLDGVPANCNGHDVGREHESSESLALTIDGETKVFGRAVVIGRHPSSSVGPPQADVFSVADPSLSKSHCVLVIVGGRLVVSDMHSKNGTSVRGQTDSDPQPLVPGQVSPPLDLPAVVHAGDTKIDVSLVAEPERSVERDVVVGGEP